jgi:hypothetical protein
MQIERIQLPRPKKSEEQEKEMALRAIEWRTFLQDYKLTEKMLGDLIGYSRRSVQMVKQGHTIPNIKIQRLFDTLKKKYERGNAV